MSEFGGTLYNVELRTYNLWNFCYGLACMNQTEIENLFKDIVPIPQIESDWAVMPIMYSSDCTFPAHHTRYVFNESISRSFACKRIFRASIKTYQWNHWI